MKKIIFSRIFQIYWKLALILCLLDAYISWSNKSQYFAPELNNQHFTKEIMFYFCLGLAAAGEFLSSIFLAFGQTKSRFSCFSNDFKKFESILRQFSKIFSFLQLTQFFGFLISRPFGVDGFIELKSSKVTIVSISSKSNDSISEIDVLGKYSQVFFIAHRHLENTTK